MKGAPPSPTGSGSLMASGSGSGSGVHRPRHRKRSSTDESRAHGWFRIPRPALSIPLMMKKNSRDDGKSSVTTEEDETAKKYRSMWIRTLSSIWMIGGFILIVYMGHLYIWAMIVVIQLYMAQELFALARAAQREKQIPGFRLLNWHFFLTAMLYVYGRFLNKHLVKTIHSDHLIPYLFKYGLIKYHMLICYSLYIAGFVWFILTLKKGMYKYQFGQFAWTHMILFVVFAQSSFTVANIFEGIIWFLLPASLIVINDIMAYFFGIFFGKTPLIKLSPKKTWEGFIGACFSTVISAFLLAYVMGQSEWLTCPRKDLSTGWLHCDPGPLFRPMYHPLPSWTPQWFPWREYGVMPVQTHAMAFGLFASLVAPFGGFFASGFKRAFNIKDFGDSIPGHGGITDRMDCQMVMAVFSYIYYQSFIAPHHYSVESFLDQILVNLSLDEQMGLYKQLGETLSKLAQK
ncbi:hypothetical protein M758_5G156700 [Ceratodon purpureus]|nr:hypothetical protein M758_5G156700 [Ceratodon purpureus]KAG0616983.1 hypothetical protein M758_5G156700 [Ceratodon purpureus]